MFNTNETKRLLALALVLLVVNGFLGTPTSASRLTMALASGPIEWINNLLISSLVLLNLSFGFNPGGRYLRDAYWSNSPQASLFQIVRNAWLNIAAFWALPIVYSLLIIWKEGGFSQPFPALLLYQLYVYQVVKTIVTIHMMAAIGLFSNFLGG